MFLYLSLGFHTQTIERLDIRIRPLVPGNSRPTRNRLAKDVEKPSSMSPKIPASLADAEMGGQQQVPL